MTIMPAIPQLSGSGICTDEDKAVSYTASCLLREHLSEYSQLSNPPTPPPQPTTVPCGIQHVSPLFFQGDHVLQHLALLPLYTLEQRLT